MTQKHSERHTVTIVPRKYSALPLALAGLGLLSACASSEPQDPVTPAVVTVTASPSTHGTAAEPSPSATSNPSADPAHVPAATQGNGGEGNTSGGSVNGDTNQNQPGTGGNNTPAQRNNGGSPTEPKVNVNGSWTHTNSEGDKITVETSGAWEVIKSDGEVIRVSASGAWTQTDHDGEVITVNADGSWSVSENGIVEDGEDRPETPTIPGKPNSSEAATPVTPATPR